MNKIESEIEETLKHLKPEKKLEVNPYFHSRLQARLRETVYEKKTSGWNFGILKPALLVLAIILNIFAALYFRKTDDKEITYKKEYYQKAAEEYFGNSDNNTFY